MKVEKLKDINIDNFTIKLESDQESILSVNNFCEKGEKIAELSFNNIVSGLYTNTKIVDSNDFDPSTAEDGIIYFVTE